MFILYKTAKLISIESSKKNLKIFRCFDEETRRMILEEEVEGLNIANLEVEEIKHWATATITQQIANSGITRQVYNLFQDQCSRSII